MKSTTTITVSIACKRVRWAVPRGFGRDYQRVAAILGPQWQTDTAGTRDLLSLVGYNAPHAVVQEWSLRKCVEANIYAANLHLRASDNSVRKHPKPRWLLAPWGGGYDCGKAGGPHSSDGAHPTVLR